MIKIPQARILNKQNWRDYFLISLEAAPIARKSLPGQFLMIRISQQNHPLLRRPLSIHAVRGDCIEIFFQISGLGTTLLSHKEKDDTVDILGPLGKGFNLETGSRQRKVALIGGGRGIAPLFFLAQELNRRGVFPRIFYGGKSRPDLPLIERFSANGFELICATDDGSWEFNGNISDCFSASLKEWKPEYIYACGPDAMLAAIARTAHKEKIPAEVSLESIMGCGFGACWGCVKKIKKGEQANWRKICEEGPVFSSDQIIWTEAEG